MRVRDESSFRFDVDGTCVDLFCDCKGPPKSQEKTTELSPYAVSLSIGRASFSFSKLMRETVRPEDSILERFMFGVTLPTVIRV